ncbi:hypothetical protein Hanom_Chr01g00059341 [Helianthus anomalus]
MHASVCATTFALCEHQLTHHARINLRIMRESMRTIYNQTYINFNKFTKTASNYNKI